MTSPNDLLRVKNPFFTGSVTDPWERCADIESINYETFQGIMHLIRKVYQEPKATHAALVFGESGLGKTHLLGRIRRSSNHDETPYVFVYIWPMVDPDTPMRHLLQSIVTDLAKDSCDISNFSTFDWLITRMLEEYITSEYGESDETLIKIRDDPSQFFTNDPSNKIDPETIRGTIDFIGVHWGIPRYLLKILFQLVIPYKKNIVTSWLRGEALDDDDCIVINVPNRINKTEAALEAEAHKIIIELGKIVSSCNRIMLVCFDQFENYISDEQVVAFGKMIDSLINRTDAILPISFMRSQLWDNKFKIKLNSSLVQRMEHNKFKLSACTIAQAYELIRKRVQFYFEDQWEEPYNWLIAELNGKIREGYYPRQIITLANDVIIKDPILKSPTPPTPCETLSEKYRNECDFVAAKLDDTNNPPDMNRLLYSLEKFLQNQPSVNGVQKTMREKINLRGTIIKNEINYNYAFIINTQVHHMSIGTCLQRGIDFMEKSEINKCIYITDPRCIVSKSTWFATNQKIELFQQQGGKIHQINKNEVNRWYALHTFLMRTTAGDISYMDDNGMTRNFTDEEISSFIQNPSKFGPPLIKVDSTSPNITITTIHPPIVEPPVPTPPMRSDEVLMGKIKGYLMESSMKSIATNMLLNKLTTAGYELQREELLRFCGSKGETFGVFGQKDDSIIMYLGLPET